MTWLRPGRAVANLLEIGFLARETTTVLFQRRRRDHAKFRIDNRIREQSGSRVLSEFIRTRIQRQVQRECRPACRRTLNSDCSAVGFRTSAYQRKPQAPADLPSRLSPPRSREWIKELGLIFAGDYRSIIVYG